ncbi:MAG: energy transducer TonB [Candidatus Acidiferrales bacterium]
MMNLQRIARALALALVVMPALIFASAPAAAAAPGVRDLALISLESFAPFDPSEDIPVVTAAKTGTVATTEGLLLRLIADPGNVQIFTDETSRISYCVRVEADSREPGAEEFIHELTVTARSGSSGLTLDGRLPWREFHGSFRVRYEIHIPRHYSVEVRTRGGNIELQDLDGRAELSTDGGNITVGRVDARKSFSRSSRGGHLAARLETLGGQITIGEVDGTLRAATSGGHITAGSIDGDAILHTGGGQIRTGRISGVADLATGGGNITAWLDYRPTRAGLDANRAGKFSETSQLFSSEGDIIVYLPRQMAATIDAAIDRDGGHRIVADSSLPLQISDGNSGSSPRTIRFEGALNGGGSALHLKATSGNILLKFAEPRTEMRVASPATWMETGALGGAQSSISRGVPYEPDTDIDADGFFAEARRRILESWWGGVPVDAAEMQRHLEHSVVPEYPDVARKAGIEGDVILRVMVSSEGRVTDMKVLEGPPILARAATEAVQQWQYRALRINGRPAAVVTTLIVSFRLR